MSLIGERHCRYRQRKITSGSFIVNKQYEEKKFFIMRERQGTMVKAVKQKQARMKGNFYCHGFIYCRFWVKASGTSTKIKVSQGCLIHELA